MGGHADRVKQLITADSEPLERNQLGRTVLHLAAAFENTAVLTVLILAAKKKGRDFCDMNAQDYIGWTPMHYAVEKRRTEAVNALLRGGADPLIQDLMEKTAFEYALDYGWHDVVDVLTPAVPNAEAYAQRKDICRHVDDSAAEMENFVTVRVPPPKSIADIPPARKSGRGAKVSFY
jgi:ankyrin repeat protein